MTAPAILTCRGNSKIESKRVDRGGAGLQAAGVDVHVDGCTVTAVAGVVGGAQVVQTGDELVRTDERADADQQRAEDVPAQDFAAGGVVRHALADAVGGNAVARAIQPDEIVDAQRQDGEDDAGEDAAGLLAIAFADDVHVARIARPEEQAVDAQGDDAQQNELDETAVRLHVRFLLWGVEWGGRGGACSQLYTGMKKVRVEL